jgi:hypothetical protein
VGRHSVVGPLSRGYGIIIYDTLRLVGTKNDYQNASETFSESLNFKNVLGEHAPRPP